MALGVLLMAGLLALVAAPARGHEFCAPNTGGYRLIPPPADDWDCDFVKDSVDNCVPLGYDDLRTRNPNQANSDRDLPGGDALGDWCDADDDADGVFDWTDQKVEYESTKVKLDNCRTVPNPGQQDGNGNAIGDACEYDSDGDGNFDSEDNCEEVPNPDQADLDGDRAGDLCDNDDDGDYVRDSSDNCPRYPNPPIPPATVQRDDDGDGIGTACDPEEIPPGETPVPTPTASPDPVPTATATPSQFDSPWTGGPNGGASNVFDRQAPRVTVRLKATQRRAEVEDGLVVRVTCSEACAVKAELVAGRKLARTLKLRGTAVVAAGTAQVDAAAATFAFVRFDARIRARLWRQASARLTLKLTVTDPAGNVRRVSEPLSLAR